MEKTDLLKQFEEVSVWREGDQRAPHKPIMLLYALSQLQHGEKLLKYSDIDKPIQNLLQTLLPHQKSINPHYPFWYLKNDGMWHIPNASNIEFRKGKKEPLKSELKKYETEAGFTDEVLELFERQPELVTQVATILLDSHFPESIQEEIISLLNLDMDAKRVSRKRDPKFREKILTAYRRQCAVCGYSVRVNDSLVGLEAAHIKWHQAGGPESEENGFSLCSIHHKLFDFGVFTVDSNFNVRVSACVNGNGAEEVIAKHDKQAILLPSKHRFYPNHSFLEWHEREVLVGDLL